MSTHNVPLKKTMAIEATPDSIKAKAGKFIVSVPAKD